MFRIRNLITLGGGDEYALGKFQLDPEEELAEEDESANVLFAEMIDPRLISV